MLKKSFVVLSVTAAYAAANTDQCRYIPTNTIVVDDKTDDKQDEQKKDDKQETEQKVDVKDSLCKNPASVITEDWYDIQK